jgi:small subunit ribosomal protein S17
MSENSKRTLIWARCQRQDGQDRHRVLVERRVKHAMYDKIIVRSSKYHAHNENNEAQSSVTRSRSRSVRPMSKTKAWASYSKLLERAVAI